MYITQTVPIREWPNILFFCLETFRVTPRIRENVEFVNTQRSTPKMGQKYPKTTQERKKHATNFFDFLTARIMAKI